MISRLPFMLLGLSLTGCGPDRVITGKDPFRNVICKPSDWEKLTRRSASFARAAGLRYGDAEYSVLLTSERLNFILARAPESREIFATAISRTEATDDDAKLFGRFLASQGLHCKPPDD